MSTLTPITEPSIFDTDLGVLELTYEGERGSKVWTWRNWSAEVVATQPNVGAMVAYKRSINGR